MQAPCLLYGRLLGQAPDTQDVDLCLDGWNLIVELLFPFREGPVLRPEAVLVDHPGLVEVIELVGFTLEFPGFPFEDGE